MKRLRLLRATALALAVVVAGVVVPLPGTPTSTAEAAADSWSVVSAPATLEESDTLLDVDAVSANDVWAVGYYVHDCGYSLCPRSLTQHWNGSTWAIVESPNYDAETTLAGVAAVAANDVWAVGYSQDLNGVQYSFIIRWNGSQWAIIPSPNVQGASTRLTSVAVVSSNEVWAVGYSSTQNDSRTLTMMWDGDEWGTIPSPSTPEGVTATFPNAQLSGVAAVGAGDVRAVGDYINGTARKTLILHWDRANSRWLAPGMPNVGSYNNYLNDVTIDTAFSGAWAVGSYEDAQYIHRPLILHWNNYTWSVVSNPALTGGSAELYSIAPVSSSLLWAVGYHRPGGLSAVRKPLGEYWNGTSWNTNHPPSASNLDNYMFGVEVVPGTSVCAGGDIWAVGRYTPNGYPSYLSWPLIERYTITPQCNNYNP